MDLNLSLDELRRLQSAFDAAVDHHSPSPNTYDLAALANTAAPAAGPGFLKLLFESPAVNALVQALIAAALAKLTAPPKPATPPIVTPPPPVAPPAVVVPPPADTRTWPAALTVDLDLFLAEGVPAPYRIEERADCYEVIKTDGTTNLPIHGGAYLHAGYLDAQGNGITFDPGSHLDHTAVWTMRRVGGRLSVFCGPGNPAKEGGDRDVANFRLAEYERTRGMDVPVHFPPAADNTVSEVVLSVDTPNGTVTSKPVRFPKVS